MRPTETWTLIKDITTSIEYSLSSVAILVGGMWVVWRFQIFRELKPRVKFEFEIEKFTDNRNETTLIVRYKVSNTGNIKIDLRKDRQRCYLRYQLLEAPIQRSNSPILISKLSEDLDPIANIFMQHGWIEPGEVIDDVKVIFIPPGRWVAVQLELVLWAYYGSIFRESKKRYSAATAFHFAGNVPIPSITSDDEQEEYDEWEELVDAVKFRIHSLHQKLESSSDVEKEKLSDLIKDAQSLIGDLKKAGAIAQEKAESFIKMVDGKLRTP